jgi:hypothetical protein
MVTGTAANTDITFYDNYIPSLKADQYTITLAQTLAVNTVQTNADQGNTDIQDPPGATQTFIVRGPRFVLDPADVHRVYPPAGAVGAYDDYIPMLVAREPSLPWERGLSVSGPNAAACPWLALLLFSPDDLLSPEPSPPAGSQQNPSRTASFPLDQVVISTFNGKATTGPPPGTLGPKIVLDDDEDPAGIQCNVIEMPVAVFAQIVPGTSELPFLSHVRVISTEATAPFKATLDTTDDGTFSVLMANRFCVPPGAGAAQVTNSVHLVSLEGFEHYLAAGAPAPPDGYQKVRMISLYSWTFNCTGDTAGTFRSLMLNLISDRSENNTNLLLRLPPPYAAYEPISPEETIAFNRLQNGYVALSYGMITGEQTFAWYRGPLSPVPTARFLETTDPAQADNVEVPLNVSDAMIYDKATGIFDQSYAVAFQTGRSLALASLPFATELLQWRRQANALVDLLMEYIQSPQLAANLQNEGILDGSGNLTAEGVTDLTGLLDANIVSNAFKAWLTTDFADSIAAQVGRAGGFTTDDAQQQPLDPPTTAPTVPADLAALMQNPTVVNLLNQLSGVQIGSGDTAAFQISTVPRQVVQWLAQTALLDGVPFNNLVPDARMLPEESIRFFYLDQNWTDALIDGALSAGLQSSRESLLHKLTRDALHRTVDAVLTQVREQFANESSGAPPAMAGFVVRSAVVSGWPGLEVRAWSAADAVNPMKPLRLDRLSPDVMLGIYPDIPAKVAFNEPSEGIVFGREDEGIAPRYLPGVTGETGANIGGVMNPANPGTWLTPAMIAANVRGGPAAQPTLNIGALVTALQGLFPAPQPQLTPGSFAVQMVRVPEQMLFTPLTGA